MKELKLATLNIAAASRERAERILDQWLAPLAPDVCVLTETSEGKGTLFLLAQFRAAGWAVYQRPTLPKDRGVAIVSRVESTEMRPFFASVPGPGRALIVELHTQPRIQLVGMYVPNRGNDPAKTKRKRDFLGVWLEYLQEQQALDLHSLLAGDLNVVPTNQTPTFLPQERFEYEWYQDLHQRAGLYDAALRHGNGHESTWVAHTGEGYTFDHIMPAEGLAGQVVRFQYDHSTRSPDGITDHSAVLLTLRLDSVSRLQTTSLVAPKQAILF